ncbi:hypothetical protein Q0F98_30105 [Paenibacillus amylolyticus]|nr:hypothetical protein Q0F98_30105 [Paenibacillus amylolyticus]
MMEPISYTNYSWSYQGIDGAVSSQELRQARVILQNELQELLSLPCRRSSGTKR